MPDELRQEAMTMDDASDARVDQLEKLVSSLRHDIRGAITPASLIADRLKMSGDPAIQRSGTKIGDAIARIVTTLNATYEQVPPRGEQQAGPVLGARGRRE
jgi:hypothetical protein